MNTDNKSKEKTKYPKTVQVYCEAINKWLPFESQHGYALLNNNGAQKAFLSNVRILGSTKIVDREIIDFWQTVPSDKPLLGDYIKVVDITINSLGDPLDVDITYEVNFNVPPDKYKVTSWYTPLELRALELDAQKSY